MNYGGGDDSSNSSYDSSSSQDNDVDESLIRELKEALHLSVGTICRAEDSSANDGSTNNDDDKDDNEFLNDLCQSKIDEDNLGQDYQDRFQKEFDLIKKKDFSRYFLIFYDLWSRYSHSEC